MELQEAHEQPDLFVPADVHSESHFSPERLAEWRRQEQEWVQESMGTRGLYSHPGDKDTNEPDALQGQQGADKTSDQLSFDIHGTSRTYSPVLAHGQPFGPLTNGHQ